MSHYIGLDLGGTNVKCGVVDADRRVRSHLSIPTDASKGPGAVVEAMAQAALDVAKKAGIPIEKVDGIGIGAPGPLDMKRGILRAAPNLPGWKDVPIRDRITQITGRPAVLENDANAAAFGEFWAGAGKRDGVRDMIMLTLGTGVGSGLIVDGMLIHGAYDLGAEAGHMIVVPNGRACGCGQAGCLESYASATATVKRVIELLRGGEPSSLLDLFDPWEEKIEAEELRASKIIGAGKRGMKRPGLDKITAKDVFDAAKAGDALALRVVDEVATYLGIACVSLCRLFDPQMIVFAGGMILAGDFLFDRVREAFRKQTWKVVESKVEIVQAVLGNDAGFIGAAAVAWNAARTGALKG
ncbi:MAG: ROK family protein [Planctomycetota bacterium]|nr:ROK family protein [Planctomycetota bacterium]